MTATRNVFLAISFACFHSALSAQVAAQDFEKPGLIPLSQTRAARIANGKNYVIDKRVENDGYFNHYLIRSRYGNFEAVGQPLLEGRIAEIGALTELEALTSSKVVMDAAKKSGQAILMAPVYTVEKAWEHISDPQKALETVQKIPEGAGKLFSWAASQAEGAYSTVSGWVSSKEDKKGDNSQSSSSSSPTIGDVSKKGQSLALDWIGYSKRERELFKQLGVNPYTSNTILIGEVERVAGIETAVGTAFRFVPGLGLLKDLGTFNRWYGRAEELALYDPPSALAEKTKAALVEQKIPEKLVDEFLRNDAYSPVTRRLIADELSKLNGVVGKEYFLTAALQAKDEPTSLYFLCAAEMLAQRHSSRPFERLIASVYLPAGVHPDGLLYIPIPVDYLKWTKETSSILHDLKKRVMKEKAIRSAIVDVHGMISPRARKELTKLGAHVVTS